MNKKIESDYYNLPIVDFMKKYDYKDYAAVRETVRKHGWRMRNLRWTPSQVDRLKEIYSDSEWSVLLEEFFPFDKEAITKKAYEQKIKRSSYHYSQEEIDLINNNIHLSTNEIVSLLPTRRTASAIDCKLNKEKVVRRAKWSNDEIEIMKKHYSNYTNPDLKRKYLHHRSLSSIQSEADKLGLSKNRDMLFTTKKDGKKEEALLLLSEYAKSIGRTPTSREVQSNKSLPGIASYHRYFGSYNKACELAGITPNTCIFGELGEIYYSINNDICFSKSEKVITDILINSKISFVKEVPYRNIVKDDYNEKVLGEKRCDWLINDKIIVEFFGMPEKEDYAKRIKQKVEICKKYNIPLIALYRKDVDRVNKKTLKAKFEKFNITLVC